MAKSNLTPERRRISHDELDALIALECASTLMESKKTRPVLADRLKEVKYGARDMGMAATGLASVLRRMYDTVPYEQLKHLRNQIAHKGVRVGVFATRAEKNDCGMVLTWEQLETFAEAAREKCLACSLDPQQQKSCKLAKLFDEMPGTKDKYSKGCGYSWM